MHSSRYRLQLSECCRAALAIALAAPCEWLSMYTTPQFDSHDVFLVNSSASAPSMSILKISIYGSLNREAIVCGLKPSQSELSTSPSRTYMAILLPPSQ